jgi:hypothetical protein
MQSDYALHRQTKRLIYASFAGNLRLRLLLGGSTIPALMLMIMPDHDRQYSISEAGLKHRLFQAA